ncbi:hypothetical protein ATANTOWER_009264 [Ataeniobius toweri]|uniref:Uncharacterized protein n=1 Tax=Ataeniobius toweri TaxID=208326 RepID=A0ABU7BNL9_9TELE|nr:hypothetical protein [Ataeniobius toweri]
METALGKLPPRFYLCSWSQKSVTCRSVSVFVQRYFRFNKVSRDLTFVGSPQQDRPRHPGSERTTGRGQTCIKF